MEYEICYLVSETKEPELEKIKEKIRKIISKEGGSFSDFEFFDKRKMAYEIENENRGIFIANRFKLSKKNNDLEAKPLKINSINRISEKMYLEKDVLRFVIVKAESVPSVKIKKKEKEEKLEKGELKKEQENKIGKLNKEIKKEKFNKEKSTEIGGKDTLKEKSEEENKKLEGIDEKLEEILNI
jgi:ribosomal protein S6